MGNPRSARGFQIGMDEVVALEDDLRALFRSTRIGEAIAKVQLGAMTLAFTEPGIGQNRPTPDGVGNRNHSDPGFDQEVVEELFGRVDLEPKLASQDDAAFEPHVRAGDFFAVARQEIQESICFGLIGKDGDDC